MINKNHIEVTLKYQKTTTIVDEMAKKWSFWGQKNLGLISKYFVHPAEQSPHRFMHKTAPIIENGQNGRQNDITGSSWD